MVTIYNHVLEYFEDQLFYVGVTNYGFSFIHLNLIVLILLFYCSKIPFSSLRDDFQKEVSGEERIQIEQSCNYFPVEKILAYLHDFILFFVRERDAEEKNYG